MRTLIALLLFTNAFLTAQSQPELEIRVVYDNTTAKPGQVQEDWGYAAVVTFRGRRLLFDSGTKPDLFMENLGKLGVKPESIESAMISHEHQDHRSGIYQLFPLHKALPVHFLDSFEGPAWDQAERIGMKPVKVTGPKELLPGMFTTGLVEGSPNEQALAVETSKGIVMMVGCSHPGIVKLVETVRRQRGKDSIRLLIGGFHMFRQQEPEISAQISPLKQLGVKEVRPAHCTGDLAHSLFEKSWGGAYGKAGAGNIIRLD
ncbi:MAG: MBL fold metallo-hydrolase [Acidimicrobiia bacterium]|nr:MBL fold metallo-hydrolase [Acidimicrobiia bacterium]